MSSQLLSYLNLNDEHSIPAKGSMPTKQEWIPFCEFELKGTRLCFSDSCGPGDGVSIALASGHYSVTTLCFSYGSFVRVAAVRIERKGTHGAVCKAVGEFCVDVGGVGISDIDKLETLSDERFTEWAEQYAYTGDRPAAGIYPCPEADTEMLFTNSGWGDGVYPVYSIVQGGQVVGAEARFIEPDEPYPFPL
jgi:hypothetical protein